MASMTPEQLEQYIALIEDERERRPAEAALVDEIKRLRQVVGEYQRKVATGRWG